MIQRLPTPTIIKIDRMVSWLLVLVSVVTIFTGYAMSRAIIERAAILQFHLVIEIVFISLFLAHLILALLIPVHWRSLWRKISKGSFSTTNWLKLIQRVSGYFLIFLAGLVILTGLDWYGIGVRELFPFLQHIRYDIFMILNIILHVAIGMHFALKRRHVSGPIVTAGILSVLVMSSLLIGVWDSSGVLGPNLLDGGELPDTGTEPPGDGEIPPDDDPNDPPVNDTIPDPPLNTKPVKEGSIRILQTSFVFNPRHIHSIRPDIFQPGYFSMFDILVHLDSSGQIPMDYHFDDEMDTFFIDSIFGISNWWYEAKYDGGWSETNNFRMDHYPWKDDASLYVYQESVGILNTYYQKFRNEIQRLEDNNDQLIIPQVSIRGNTFNKVFTNVVVTAHNWRTDVFTVGKITALDVILSLADQGEITYEIEWVENILGITVKHYWIQGIDKDIASGRCGFVYESGYHGVPGNHIHLPPDSRVLTSPEYVLFFWICI